MSWWKHFVHGFKHGGGVFRMIENAGRNAVGKPTVEQASAARQAAAAPPPSADAGSPGPMGGAAETNSGDAVTNFQTKGAPGLQGLPNQPKPGAATMPNGSPTGGS